MLKQTNKFLQPSRATGLLNILDQKVTPNDPIRIQDISGFKEIQVLGNGRFGEVVKFMDMTRRTFVTCKTVKMEMFDHWSQDMRRISVRLNNFIAEFRILREISHNSDRIANFIGIYSDMEKLYIFTEYLPNGSVRDRITKESLSEETATRYFSQTVEAVSYLHNMNPPIIHRDIKAANLLITISGSIKLANFGLVRDLAVDGFGTAIASEISLDFRGTLLYAAPEVLSSELGPGNRMSYGMAADIWAIGCTFVEMLVRHPPHFEYFGKVDCMQAELLARATGPEDQRLSYKSEVLCNTASQQVKEILDAIFVEDPIKRPTAKQLTVMLPQLKRDLEHRDNYEDFYNTVCPEPTNLNQQAYGLEPSTSKGPDVSEDKNKEKGTIETEENEMETSFTQSTRRPLTCGQSQTTTGNGGLFRLTPKPKKKRGKRRRGKLEKTSICIAYHGSRCLYFSGILSRAIFYVITFLGIGMGTLAAFLFIAFATEKLSCRSLMIFILVYVGRLIIADFCECDLMTPQALIIGGILLILLFALMFSCCMVALGEYKFRKANRTLQRSRFWVPRPESGLRLCGIRVIGRPHQDTIDSDMEDLEAGVEMPTIPPLRDEAREFFYD